MVETACMLGLGIVIALFAFYSWSMESKILKIFFMFSSFIFSTIVILVGTEIATGDLITLFDTSYKIFLLIFIFFIFFTIITFILDIIKIRKVNQEEGI